MQLSLAVMSLLLPYGLTTSKCLEPYDLSNPISPHRRNLGKQKCEQKVNMYDDEEKVSKNDEYKYEDEMAAGTEKNKYENLGKEDKEYVGCMKSDKGMDQCEADKYPLKNMEKIHHNLIQTQVMPAMKSSVSKKIIIITEVHHAAPPSAAAISAYTTLGAAKPSNKPKPMAMPIPMLMPIPMPMPNEPPKPLVMLGPSGTPKSVFALVPTAVTNPFVPPPEARPNPVNKPEPTLTRVAPAGTEKVLGTSMPLITNTANFKSAAIVSIPPCFSIMFSFILSITFML